MSAEYEDDVRADFLAEAGELVERLGGQLIELERSPADKDLLNAVFRGFHTVKGGAGFLALEPMVALCHAAEEVFNALRNGKCAMDAALMDSVLQALDLLQEMMTAMRARRPLAQPPQALLDRLRAPLQQPAAPAPEPATQAAPEGAVMPASTAPVADAFSDDEFEALLDQLHGTGQAPCGLPPVQAPAEQRPVPVNDGLPTAKAHAEPPDSSVRVDTAALDSLMNLVGELVLVRNRLKTLCGRSGQTTVARGVGELDHITRGLQAAVMRVRMQPMRRVFSRFPKLAREVARGLGKQVDLELSGEDTGLDKSLVEGLADPLIHMVRNAVDHGIEMPEQRVAAGKPPAGTLKLGARQMGDHIEVTVSDDGAGIDFERLRRKAVEKNLIDAAEAARLTPEECLQLVFLPGLSTKDQLSELSGRGVGMDVVKSSIAGLGGSVHIESRPGRGTEVRIRLPLTLAILTALMVRVGNRLLALPLTPVLDVFELQPGRVRSMNGQDVVLYRDRTLRLIHLRRWLGNDVPEEPVRHVAVAQVDSETCGFVVSQVIGREEVVVKPLGSMLSGLAGVAGATVTGDGRVALIVDLQGLASAVTHSGGNFVGREF